jgi:hypothetical protein
VTEACSLKELSTCHIVIGDRAIVSQVATSVVALHATYINGYFDISTNPQLTRLDFPSLSTVIGYLYVQSNFQLTYTYVPKLTFIGGSITICGSHSSFAVPSGPPNGPAGGLVVTGFFKGTGNCYIRSGAVLCRNPVYSSCP